MHVHPPVCLNHACFLLYRFELGIAFRVKYGHLLKGFTELPVFRTTSQGQNGNDSALNPG